MEDKKENKSFKSSRSEEHTSELQSRCTISYANDFPADRVLALYSDFLLLH